MRIAEKKGDSSIFDIAVLNFFFFFFFFPITEITAWPMGKITTHTPGAERLKNNQYSKQVDQNFFYSLLLKNLK